MNPPPIPDDQRRKDTELINLLSIFHFVVSGLALFGIAFLFLHHFMMRTFMRPELWKGHPGGGPPPEFFQIFIWFYLFMGVVMVIACIANILSGVFLRQRKFRTFSLIVAGLNCLQIPIGTALGVGTIIVLLRDSVRQSYSG